MSENPTKLKIIEIRPEHASGNYLNSRDCALYRAAHEAGIPVWSVAGSYARLNLDGGDDDLIQLIPPFYNSDFLAVRAGKTISYVYNPEAKTMTMVSDAPPQI